MVAYFHYILNKRHQKVSEGFSNDLVLLFSHMIGIFPNWSTPLKIVVRDFFKFWCEDIGLLEECEFYFEAEDEFAQILIWLLQELHADHF